MSLPIQLALVSEGVDVDSAALTSTAAALSKQVQRDFAPIWNVNATIDAFLKLEDVPTDYWPIIVMKDVQDAAGYHEDKNGQPFAVVQFGDQWSLTASHECLEMLADPFGRRMKAANLLPQAIQLGQKPNRVRYLVEVCDPGESAQFAYQVNGILVSDFYTPHFFDPVKAAGVRYSYTGAIDSPLTILDGGYISWEDSITQHWYQLRMFSDDISSDVPHVIDLSAQTAFLKYRETSSLRSAVDRVTKPPKYLAGLTAEAVTATEKDSDLSVQAQKARARDLRKEVNQLIHPRGGSG